MAKLVLSQFGPEHLLTDRAARTDISQSLRPEDASRLARLLGFAAAPDPYATIVASNFRRGTHPFNTLVAFFGVSLQADDAESLPAASEPLHPAYPLFDHQRHAGREVYAHLTDSSPPRVLLHMPTEAGKTRTAMHVISLFLRHQARDDEVVVWLAHTEELCEQAAEEFADAWRPLDDRPVTVSRHFGPHRVDLDAENILKRINFPLCGRN